MTDPPAAIRLYAAHISVRAKSLVAAVLAWAPSLGAQPRDAGVISMGEPAWPDVHYGQPVPVDAPRPTDDLGRVASTRAPVTVHLGAGVSPALVDAALDAAARTLDYCERALRLEGPWPDGLRGGDPGLDVYLLARGGSDTPVDAMVTVAPWDRASAFVIASAEGDPARVRRAVAEGVARAVILGVKADHPPRVLWGLGRVIAERALDLPADLDAVRAFQSEPWRAVLGGPVEGEDEVTRARGAGLFFTWLLARHDNARNTLLESVIRGSVGWTEGAAPRLVDEPDAIDHLRRLFRDEPLGLRGAFAQFCAQRALAGWNGDESASLPAPDLGARARELSWRALPVWVRPAAPTEPTGCQVVNLDLGDAPLDGDLTLWLHAVPWRRWLVRVLRVNAQGVALPSLDTLPVREGEWSMRLDGLREAKRVVIAVTDLGDETFEPDMPQSANGWFVLHVARDGR